MDKKCICCNFEVEEYVQYCPKCASTEFVPLKKGKSPQKYFFSGWQIILMAVAGLIVFFILAWIFGGGITDMLYTKGTIKDNVYTNPWASIQFEANKTFAISDEELFSKYETDTVEIGFGCMAKYSQNFFLLYFEDTQSIMTAEEYLKMKKAELANEYGIVSMSAYSYVTIAGYEYVYTEVTLHEENISVHMYVRIHGGYAIVFCNKGIDKNAVENLLEENVTIAV